MEYVRINNRKNFLLANIPDHVPGLPSYIYFWREQKKRCIEGFWGIDNERVNIDIRDDDPYSDIKAKGEQSWRYIPPALYFYANFGTIKKRIEGAPKSAPQRKARPDLRDIDWEFFYNWMEARGFSGFDGDNEYTCNRDVLLYEKEEIDKKELLALVNNKSNVLYKGKVKKYKEASEYLRELFKNPLGNPVYDNDPKNLFVFTARSVGKSYWAAIVNAHEIRFDGSKEYNREIQGEIAEVVIGASIKDKSKDLIDKVKMSFENFPGKYKEGSVDEIPSPLERIMTGSTAPGTNNYWRNVYKTYDQNGGNAQVQGSGSGLKHVIFTKQNPEAAVGGRNTTITIEEVGLTGDILHNIYSACESNLNPAGQKMGSALYIGTSGNLSKIQGPMRIFQNPADYNMIGFDNKWEATGRKIGWFIPAIYGYNEFRDENGNLDVERATAKWQKEHDDKKSSIDSTALDYFLMYYPMEPSHMFLSAKTNKFPLVILNKRKAEHLSNKKLLNAGLRGYFSQKGNEVTWDVLDRVYPIREYPLPKNKSSIGCVEMWEPPRQDTLGEKDRFRYIAALDPVDDDEDDTTGSSGRSLQSFFIFDLYTDRIVLEYSARTPFAADFYEQVRLALIYYNCKLLYENQKKGLYWHMDKKNSLNYLEDTPKETKDSDHIGGRDTKNIHKGVWINTFLKNRGLKLLEEYLRTQAINKVEGVCNAEIIRGIALIEELLLYSKDVENADRISSLIVLMLYREFRKLKLEKKRKKTKIKIKNDDFWTRNIKQYETFV